MKYKESILAAALALASLSFAGSAGAAPVGPIQNAMTTEKVDLQTVHYRPYRHCHRRWGRRWCHGGYSYGPSINFYFGRGHRHRHFGHRHHRHHGFGGHHRHRSLGGGMRGHRGRH